MLEIEEALQLVLSRAAPLRPQTLSAEESLGLVLAESIHSDIDSPPHDKSIVDGYAIIAADTASSSVELALLEEITAGETPQHAVHVGHCSRIMTGAPIPQGADAVVMVERTELIAAYGVRILQSGVKPGQNIMRRAASLACGQQVLSASHVLRAIEVGLLNEVGRCEVQVHPRPRVAVLATGNELVPASDKPAASQIRNSNGPMLSALVRQAGGMPIDLGIGRDDAAQLRACCQRGLQCEVLVISGGVSAGVLDLVPGVLDSLGIEQVFHKINLKPGKPLWFGVQPDSNTLVFGLPGNPVSSLVCFELFVRPALARLAGSPNGGLARAVAQLTSDYHHRGDRVTMYPAALQRHAQSLLATPLINWRGSGDIYSFTSAQGLIHFPVGERHYRSGDEVSVLMF